MPELDVLEKHITRIEDTLLQKAKELGEEKHKELTEELGAVQKQYAELHERLETQQKAYDDLDMRFQNRTKSESKQRYMKSAIHQLVGDEYSSAREKIKDGQGLTLNTKATMVQSGVSSAYTGQVVLPYQPPEIFTDPFADPIRARNLIPQGTTGRTSAVNFVANTANNGTIANQAEGELKSELDNEFTATLREIRTLAATVRISKQMLDDKETLQSFLSNMLTQRMANHEDDQIINGDNTGENLDGLINNATTVTQINSGAATDANAQNIDALRAGILHLALQKYQAERILIDPTVYYNTLGLKDADQNYLQAGFTYTNDVLRLYGVPVIPHTAMPTGVFLMGAFSQASQYLMREGLSLRFFEEDRDNVPKNLITVRLEMRSVLITPLPKALATANIATLITDLQA